MYQKIAGAEYADTEIYVICEEGELCRAIHQNVEAVDTAVELTVLIKPDQFRKRGVYRHFAAVRIYNNAVHDRAEHCKPCADERGGEDLAADDGQYEREQHDELQRFGIFDEFVVPEPCADYEEAVASAG